MAHLQELDNILLNHEVDEIRKILPKNLDEKQVENVFRDFGITKFTRSYDEILDLRKRLESFSDKKRIIENVSYSLLPDLEKQGY